MSRKLLAALLASAALAACGEENPTTPTTGPSFDGADASTLAAEVRSLAAGRGIVPLVRPAAVRPELVQLGQALAFDKILSGNRDISCMTCHLPTFGTGDGLSRVGGSNFAVEDSCRLEHHTCCLAGEIKPNEMVT